MMTEFEPLPSFSWDFWMLGEPEQIIKGMN